MPKAGAPIAAVILDLDGVITDTAEHHYRAWRRLAEELGIPCPPDLKDRVRGVSRRRSLDIVLAGRAVDEKEAEELMARKNRYYQELIQGITPADLLPGAGELLAELRASGVKVAVATVSRNAETVLARLGIRRQLDALVDGNAGVRSKPAPDLFLRAAALLEVPPGRCLVIEDAAAGIAGARAAGMWAVGLGSEERFREVYPDLVLPSLAGVSWGGLQAALAEELARREKWTVREERFDPGRQRQRETVFTVGNGYLGTRGTLEEGHPGDLPATLISGLYDGAPLVHKELAPAPNWTSLEIKVGGEWFSLSRGQLLAHERALYLRNGSLRRRVRWRSPQGHTVQLEFERWASLADPHLCALRVWLTALDFEGEVEVRAILDGAAETPGIAPPGDVGLSHWTSLGHGHPTPQRATLCLRTRTTGVTLAAASQLEVEGPEAIEYGPARCPLQPGVVARFRLRRGETAVVTKLTSLWTSNEAPDPLKSALADLDRATETGYTSLHSRHRAEWEGLWGRCDVEIEGDERAQLAVRFNLYHLLIAAPYHTEGTSIPAKALSGFGYRGHVFWDTDVFMLPFFALTLPQVARKLLLYRYHTLPSAREKAREAGYHGAMFAWESADDGRETTPRWVPGEGGEPVPILCGELEQHITADVAYAVWFYWQTTGDDDFMRDHGAELVLSAAAFWASRVEYDPEKGRYRIRGVMGPDEYHDRVDDNAFTNAMARWNLEFAQELWGWLRERFPRKAEKLMEGLGLHDGELAYWREVAERLYVPHDPNTGLIEQFDGYFRLRDLDLGELEPRESSMQSLLGEGVKETQVIKQPDVLMLLYLLRDRYDKRTVRANWDHYEPRTDHDFGSSLGPAIHAALACELGEPEGAYRHFLRAALVDLEDLRGNTADGIHAASCGGVWQALMFGFAGLRLTPDGPITRPRLPGHWRRLGFSIHYRGREYRFDLTPDGPSRGIPEHTPS